MATLSTPNEDLAARVLREVDYPQRLVGYRMRERLGAIPVSLYSFEEVVHLLGDKCPYVNLQRLEEWIATVTQDSELAVAIARVTQEETNDRDRLSRIGPLMGERLCQCKKAVQS